MVDDRFGHYMNWPDCETKVNQRTDSIDLFEYHKRFLTTDPFWTTNGFCLDRRFINAGTTDVPRIIVCMTLPLISV